MGYDISRLKGQFRRILARKNANFLRVCAEIEQFAGVANWVDL